MFWTSLGLYLVVPAAIGVSVFYGLAPLALILLLSWWLTSRETDHQRKAIMEPLVAALAVVCLVLPLATYVVLIISD
jgi:Flp pilus assembly protein TadB